jgi:membrane-bound lytic murein transglycosylase D
MLTGSKFIKHATHQHVEARAKAAISAIKGRQGLPALLLVLLVLQGCSQVPRPVGTVDGNEAPPTLMEDTLAQEMNKDDRLSPPRDAWQRLRRGFQLAEPGVGAAIEAQAAHMAEQGLPSRVCRRAAPLLYMMLEEAEQRRLPMEVVLLPMVESSFQAHARSPVGAHGPWQFMPATARQHGLAINRVHDDRRAWQHATHAALDMLQELHGRFGDWHLAMAAYNAGPGRVQQALRRVGGDARFEELWTLPQETRQYLVHIFAWRRILQSPQHYGIALPPAPNAPVLEEIPLAYDMDVSQAAHLAGVSEAGFRHWNPAFAGPLIPGATHPVLLLPAEEARRFRQALAQRRAQRAGLASWSLQRLARAATAPELARRWRVDSAALLAANPLASGQRYKANSVLFVPRRLPEQADATAIRYAALASEPIPKPRSLHKAKTLRRQGPLPGRAVRVNYLAKAAPLAHAKRRKA